MTKIFVAYRHTGESEESLTNLLVPVTDTLQAQGLEVYCSFFQESMFQARQTTPREIMQHAFFVLSTCDALLVLQRGMDKSEGMLMEVGWCLSARIPVIVAQGPDTGYTYLPSMSDWNLRWETVDDLRATLRELDVATTIKLITPGVREDDIDRKYPLPG